MGSYLEDPCENCETEEGKVAIDTAFGTKIWVCHKCQKKIKKLIRRKKNIDGGQ